MTKYIVTYDQHPVFLDFICQRLNVKLDPATARTVSHVRVNEDGTHTMLAVCAYNNWTERSCELSIAGTKSMWATRRYIQAVYEYAFTVAEKERIHMVVEHTNADALELHKRLGHKHEGELEDWFGEDKPAIVFGLTKRNYLKGKWAPKHTDRTQEA